MSKIFSRLINRPLPPFSAAFHFRIFIFAAVIFNCSLLTAFAQEERPKNLPPPPPPVLSESEKEQLEGAENAKKRTQLALDFMELRVKKAEELSAQKQYNESLVELAGFQALIYNTLKHLNRNNAGNKQSLNNFKRFEINLRQYFPRLEILRREMPVKYSYHVGNLMKYVRQARTKATDPLFGETVLPGK